MMMHRNLTEALEEVTKAKIAVGDYLEREQDFAFELVTYEGFLVGISERAIRRRPVKEDERLILKSCSFDTNTSIQTLNGKPLKVPQNEGLQMHCLLLDRLRQAILRADGAESK